jgi:hypothetical protein
MEKGVKTLVGLSLYDNPRRKGQLSTSLKITTRVFQDQTINNGSYLLFFGYGSEFPQTGFLGISLLLYYTTMTDSLSIKGNLIFFAA